MSYKKHYAKTSWSQILLHPSSASLADRYVSCSEVMWDVNDARAIRTYKNCVHRINHNNIIQILKTLETMVLAKLPQVQFLSLPPALQLLLSPADFRKSSESWGFHPDCHWTFPMTTPPSIFQENPRSMSCCWRARFRLRFQPPSIKGKLT